MTQFVQCGFTPEAKRLYTYRNDAAPVAPGDFVRVAGKGEATKTIEVVAIADEEPPYECKPIIGLGERPDGWPAADPAQLDLEGK
jgi:hypothetical protein